eukprot:TRINITY_DN14391_c0_g1_i1.p1 TRINITY_DN14391_c0_g1~~TRINITY_DN14391_c0_g1_i1.p1  ORF type:complete len:213 (+),score=36.27 TRINITY_DN14391_c0_g1_i1:95-733(+)
MSVACVRASACVDRRQVCGSKRLSCGGEVVAKRRRAGQQVTPSPVGLDFDLMHPALPDQLYAGVMLLCAATRSATRQQQQQTQSSPPPFRRNRCPGCGRRRAGKGVSVSDEQRLRRQNCCGTCGRSVAPKLRVAITPTYEAHPHWARFAEEFDFESRLVEECGALHTEEAMRWYQYCHANMRGRHDRIPDLERALSEMCARDEAAAEDMNVE